MLMQVKEIVISVVSICKSICLAGYDHLKCIYFFSCGVLSNVSVKTKLLIFKSQLIRVIAHPFAAFLVRESNSFN